MSGEGIEALTFLTEEEDKESIGVVRKEAMGCVSTVCVDEIEFGSIGDENGDGNGDEIGDENGDENER